MANRYDNILLKKLLDDGIPTVTAMEIAEIKETGAAPVSPPKAPKAPKVSAPAKSAGPHRAKAGPTTRVRLDVSKSDRDGKVTGTVSVWSEPDGSIHAKFTPDGGAEGLLDMSRGLLSNSGKSLFVAWPSAYHIRNPADPNSVLVVQFGLSHDIRTDADKLAAKAAREAGLLAKLKAKAGETNDE